MNNILYSIPIGNKDKKENETQIYRHPFMKDKKVEDIIKTNTLQDTYRKLLKTPEKELFGFRKELPLKEGEKTRSFENKFTWLKVSEIFSLAESLGSGLVNMNLVEEINEWNNMKLKFVGIYSTNNINYFLSDIACGLYDIVSVPIYDTLGEEATQFAFDQTKMITCFVTSNHVEKILIAKRDHNLYQDLKNLIIMDKDKFKNELREKYENVLNIFTFEEVIEKGKTNILKWANLTPESIYSFSYTSGTTGTPKGAMISQRNICSSIDGSKYSLELYTSDVYLSYLPMAHVMERAFFNCMIHYGVKVGVYCGDNLKLVEDLGILKPTIFVSVPRLYNKMYDKIMAKVGSLNGCLKKLFRCAIDTKLSNLHKKGQTTHWFWDKVFFQKMKMMMGGKVRVMATGSAPISPEILDFLKIAFCAPIVEGYGQTEGLAFQFVTNVKDGISGHVGGPTVQNEFKLVDVPEMNYTNKDKDEKGRSKPRGEIWMRGANVIPGYYKLDEKNKESFNEEGWLLSGDIAELTPGTNSLRIIDRKKNIFKLSQGEYIAPEKLENIYKNAHNLIEDIFVYGDSLKSCLVAVVNVDIKNICQLKEDLGVDKNSTNFNKEFINNFLNLFLKTSVEYKLNSLEKIRGVIVDTRSWQDLDLITTSFKKKRNELKTFYSDKIEELYKTLY